MRVARERYTLSCRVNSVLQRGTNISKSEIITKWSVFPGTVTYIYLSQSGSDCEKVYTYLSQSGICNIQLRSPWSQTRAVPIAGMLQPLSTTSIIKFYDKQEWHKCETKYVRDLNSSTLPPPSPLTLLLANYHPVTGMTFYSSMGS